jgi:hypothetical protein
MNFKGTPSREEHKIGFSVLTTIELNLPVEFTKFCKRRAPYIEFLKKPCMNHQLRAKSYTVTRTDAKFQHIWWMSQDQTTGLMEFSNMCISARTVNISNTFQCPEWNFPTLSNVNIGTFQ